MLLKRCVAATEMKPVKMQRHTHTYTQIQNKVMHTGICRYEILEYEALRY